MINHLCNELKQDNPKLKEINTVIQTRDEAMKLLFWVQSNRHITKAHIKINFLISPGNNDDDLDIIMKCAKKIKKHVIENRNRVVSSYQFFNDKQPEKGVTFENKI